MLFNTDASTLVAGDTNGRTDVFPARRDTNADGVFDEPGAVSSTRVSEGAGGVQADADATGLVMTPDARFVVFESAASTLSPQPVGRHEGRDAGQQRASHAGSGAIGFLVLAFGLA